MDGGAVSLDVYRQVANAGPNQDAFGGGGALTNQAGPFVDVPSLVRALRRRWRVWVVTAVLGLVAAAGFSMAFPPAHSATTLLLLRHPPQSDPSRAMITDAELIKGRSVAQRAVDRSALGVSAKELVTHYRAIPLSDEVLQVTAEGPTSTQAVRRANGVAEAFLSFRRDEFRRQSQVVVQALEERQEALSEELSGINDRLNRLYTGTGEGSESAARALGDLLTRRSAIYNELSELRRRIDAVTLDNRSVIEKSRIADPAVTDDRSPLRSLAANLAAGLVCGIALGSGWVVVQEVVSDRVRRRDEVMAALGAPSVVSVGPLKGSLRAQRRRFQRHLGEPQREIARLVRYFRHQLPAAGSVPPSLVVVSVRSDGAAAVALASMAVKLIDEGRSVLLADLSSSSALARLLHSPNHETSTDESGVTGAPSWVTLFTPGPLPSSTTRCTCGALLLRLHSVEHLSVEHLGRDLDPEELRREADVVLVLATLDPALDDDGGYLSRWGTNAVAVVTAGRSTVTALRSAAQVVRAAGLRLDSAVLVGADRNDEGVGVSNGSSPSPWPDALPLPTNQ